MKAKKPTQDVKTKVVLAALEQAALLGWEHVSLQDLAQDSGVSLAGIHDHFEDKFDILAGIGRMIDRRTLENIGARDPGCSERDRLFEIMMERFDVMAEYRDGIAAILGSFRGDPKQALVSGPHFCRSMCWMLEASGIPTNGMKGALKIAGLSALYLKVLRVWLRDESADMSATMAALDKELGRAESVANSLGF